MGFEKVPDGPWASYCVPVAFVALALSYYASLALYNLFLHPLSRFPGPLIKRAFALPGILEIWFGTSVQNTHALHAKYGSVVRVAPDALSFTSAQAWKGWIDILSHCAFPSL